MSSTSEAAMTFRGNLTPEQARERAAALMADGRWRTAADVAHALRMPRVQASRALQYLMGHNMLVGDPVVCGGERLMTYRMPKQEAAE